MASPWPGLGKEDKRLGNRKIHRSNRVRVATGGAPVPGKVLTDPWTMDKDGKQYFPMIREECWMLPARFVRNIMECRGTKVTLEKNAVARGARSFAHWLVYDVIGLWTGDERSEIIRKAEGSHKGRKPRFLVAVTVHKGKRHQGENINQIS
ncbi:MAG: hypothetical protein HQL81_00790 [Magnetococcales bacterium]|nr:hypothetical protein [Magnetococcales bacterium]